MACCADFPCDRSDGLMKWILLFCFGILIICSVFVRTLVFHPFNFSFYLQTDIFHFFRWKLYNKASCGRLDCYCADFGGGKTLSMAHFIYKFNKRYNGKRFYDSARKEWVTQHVVVLSNFTVDNVDCVPLNTLSDIDVS